MPLVDSFVNMQIFTQIHYMLGHAHRINDLGQLDTMLVFDSNKYVYGFTFLNFLSISYFQINIHEYANMFKFIRVPCM